MTVEQLFKLAKAGFEKKPYVLVSIMPSFVRFQCFYKGVALDTMLSDFEATDTELDITPHMLRQFENMRERVTEEAKLTGLWTE